MKLGNMKLDVPYYSQFVDIEDPFWMLRGCGACAMKEVFEFYGEVVPDLLTLCKEAQETGGYDMENGWMHAHIVNKAVSYGLKAYRKEGISDVVEILSSLKDGKPVIVSVEKRVLEQTRFHIILLVGFEEHQGNVSQFYYHESESTNKEKGKYRSCSKETFLQFFRGKAIFISK